MGHCRKKSERFFTLPYFISIIYLGPTPNRGPPMRDISYMTRQKIPIALGNFDLPIFHFGVKMAALSAKPGLVFRNSCYKPTTFPGPTPD
jgi:hypothetical protein